jgi:DNA-directed RNA polymerase specialized sigma24 family protein
MSETLEQMAMAHEVCPKCSHFKSCRTPCYPVGEQLRRDNLAVFEKSYTDPETGQTTTILFSRSRELPESDLPQDDGKTASEYPKAFSTENENPFAGFTPNLKQTGIFVDRFFHGFSYADLATKYEMSKDTARKTYHNAIKRLLEILKAMDGDKRLDLSQYRKQVEERSGKLPKGQKWFLLNKLFGIMPSEIAEMEGLQGSSVVRQLIIRVSDQLRAGEIRLIDTSPEESAAAKKRLDEQREKRRGRGLKFKGDQTER